MSKFGYRHESKEEKIDKIGKYKDQSKSNHNVFVQIFNFIVQ